MLTIDRDGKPAEGRAEVINKKMYKIIEFCFSNNILKSNVFFSIANLKNIYYSTSNKKSYNMLISYSS